MKCDGCREQHRIQYGKVADKKIILHANNTHTKLHTGNISEVTKVFNKAERHTMI